MKKNIWSFITLFGKIVIGLLALWVVRYVIGPNNFEDRYDILTPLDDNVNEVKPYDTSKIDIFDCFCINNKDIGPGSDGDLTVLGVIATMYGVVLVSFIIIGIMAKKDTNSNWYDYLGIFVGLVVYMVLFIAFNLSIMYGWSARGLPDIDTYSYFGSGLPFGDEDKFTSQNQFDSTSFINNILLLLISLLCMAGFRFIQYNLNNVDGGVGPDKALPWINDKTPKRKYIRSMYYYFWY